MHCLSENVGADIDYVESIRGYCALAGVPGRAVGFIEVQASKQFVRQTLIAERALRSIAPVKEVKL